MSSSMDKLRAKAMQTMGSGSGDPAAVADRVLSGAPKAVPAEVEPPRPPAPAAVAEARAPRPAAKRGRSKPKPAAREPAEVQGPTPGLGFASLKPAERMPRGDGTRRKPIWRDRDQTWVYHTSFYLPEALDQEIEVVRERYGITRQAMLEHAVKRLLEEERRIAGSDEEADAAE